MEQEYSDKSKEFGLFMLLVGYPTCMIIYAVVGWYFGGDEVGMIVGFVVAVVYLILFCLVAGNFFIKRMVED